MGLFGKHRLVHTRSCKAFPELPPCRWPSRRLLLTIRQASGDGTSRQLDVKRPNRLSDRPGSRTRISTDKTLVWGVPNCF